jgi:hypothetical protein
VQVSPFLDVSRETFMGNTRCLTPLRVVLKEIYG